MRPHVVVLAFLLVVCLGSVSAQVVTAPRLTGVSGGGAVDLGQRVVLTASVSGGTATPGLQYQWRKNGTELAGQVSANLVIESAAASDSGTFTVVVSNSAGASSASAEVTVRPAAAPVITVQPRALTLDTGQTAFFSFVATGSFPRTYQWRKDGTNLPGATNAALSLSAVTNADVGVYSVQVSNAVGSVVSASAALTVNAARRPVMGAFSADAGSTVQGQRASFAAPVINGSTPFSYQWRKDGSPIAGATDAVLTFDGIAFTDAGTYSVSVTNVAGVETSPDLRVTVEPAIAPLKVKLRNSVVILGHAFELQDPNSAFERQPTLYQWYIDGRAIPQATNARYQVAASSIASAGSYYVVTTNIAGSTTSDTSLISVLATNGSFNAPWLAADRDADIVYFTFANPARIERFNLATDTWLSPISLPRTPTASVVHNGVIYVAFGPVISRFSLDGTAESSVTSGFLYNVPGLQAWNGFLFAADGNGQLTTVRLNDGIKDSSLPYPASMYQPAVVAKSTGVIYARNSSHSGSLVAMKVQANGSLTALPSFSNLGQLPYGERLFLSRDEQRVLSEGGRVFSASTLDLVGSLGARFDDVDFTPDGEPVVLRGGTLHVHDPNLYEKRRLVTQLAGARLFVRNSDALIFGTPDSIGRPAKVRVSLAEAQALADATPLSAETFGFTPDAVLVDRDDVVLLYSKVHRQIFRWSTAQRHFLAPITLRDWPNRIAYSATNHRIYIAHADSRLSQVKLDAGATTVEPFATVPQQELSVATAGEYVLIDFSESAFSSATRLLFDRDGRQRYLGGGYSSDYTWSPSNRRLYHFRDDSSPNDLLFTEIKADGSVGERRDSPYHGGISTTLPIRVSPNGSAVLLGSGKFFDGNTLAASNSLPHPIQDAQWVGSRVVTGRVTARGIEIQRWSGSNYDLDRTAVIPGRLIGLLALAGERALAVTVVNGLVHFTLFNQELAVLSSDSVRQPERLANISSRAAVGRGDEVLIPGFVIAGADPKTVLIRAVGPGLGQFGVSGALVDPSFTVHNAAGAVIASNDNWSAGTNTSFLGPVSSRVGAFSLGRESRDAAAVVTLDPGAYTVQIRGVGDATGVALVELYDAQDNSGGSRLINIATRAVVGTEGNILIAGVVVQTERPKTVLIRAIGPTLAAFGVGGALANPRLQVFREGQIVAENDDWGQSATAEQIRAAAVRTGAFALGPGSLDSAVLVELPAGSYSVHVSGVGGTTGVALAEVYEVP